MIEARILGNTSPDVMSYSIAGRSLASRSWDELEQMRNYWRNECEKEKEKELTDKGIDNPKRVGIRFNRV